MTLSTGMNDTNRVLTLNIFCRHANWNERRQVLADGLRSMQPDVIAFQETIVTGDYDQVQDILGEEYHVVHSTERSAEGMGISIASRWPITSTAELDLHVTARTSDFPCTTLIAEIEAPASFGPTLLVNHFPDYQTSHEHERELQTVVAARAIEERLSDRAVHVILAGDLDAEPDAASMRFLSGKQSLDEMSVCYRNAWESAHPDDPGHTFTNLNTLKAEAAWDWPFKRIDHIFVRCGPHDVRTRHIASCDLAFAEPRDGVWASDHIGVIADLTNPAPGQPGHVQQA